MVLGFQTPKPSNSFKEAFGLANGQWPTHFDDSLALYKPCLYSGTVYAANREIVVLGSRHYCLEVQEAP